ncbi:TPA: hypothetical protein KOR49_003808 [Clostridioides difficile]|uniref:hypothetical protein n=1 Tax=Clostridioides difficile TaxID=1496 RepID=UPI00016C6459|nr:hypothetical protein [Clostridioides difficile]EGT3944106.1 hypothetical protein [Clostridioides difficile]MBG0197976.1 hypothetical protein [Clostridioides difficile]MCA0574647.1 hypothetical protein [Clostridioides difficile]PBG25655.1 hypothetical protein BGU81_12645 [Clostridioides difficile]SJT20590.1 Uncharacterised protein [Clostridioides difficile]
MYSKNIPIHVLINIVLFGLSIYMFKIIIDDNLIESEENERRYKLDYSLEDNVIKTIKSNNVVDFRKLAKVNFSKISVHSSYDTLGDFKGDIRALNSEAPKNNFSYILFLDENEKVVKTMVLNEKYDISRSRSHREYLSKNATFKFNKVDKENEVTYRLEE